MVMLLNLQAANEMWCHLSLHYANKWRPTWLLLERDPTNDDPTDNLIGVTPLMHEERSWLKPLTMWELLHCWEAPTNNEIFIRLYEFVASTRSVPHIRPWRQRVREVPNCEFDLLKLALPQRKRKTSEGQSRRVRGRGRGARRPGRGRGEAKPVEDDDDREKKALDDARRIFGSSSEHSNDPKDTDDGGDGGSVNSGDSKNVDEGHPTCRPPSNSGSELFFASPRDSSSSSAERNPHPTLRDLWGPAQDRVLVSGPPRKQGSDGSSTPPSTSRPRRRPRNLPRMWGCRPCQCLSRRRHRLHRCLQFQPCILGILVVVEYLWTCGGAGTKKLLSPAAVLYTSRPLNAWWPSADGQTTLGVKLAVAGRRATSPVERGRAGRSRSCLRGSPVARMLASVPSMSMSGSRATPIVLESAQKPSATRHTMIGSDWSETNARASQRSL